MQRLVVIYRQIMEVADNREQHDALMEGGRRGVGRRGEERSGTG